MLKYEDDLYQLHNDIKDVGYTVILTATTLGVGWLSGLKALNLISKMGRSIAIANGSFGAITSGIDLKNTFQECVEESKLVTELSANSNLYNENICADPNSPLSQAQEEESNCIMSVLLSAPGILPFVGSVPGLAKFLPKNRSIKSIYTSGVTNKRLYTNASTMQKLVEEQKFDEAKTFIISEMKKSGIDINDEKAEAILRAHMDASCVVGKCNHDQLKIKRNKMKGESDKEILKKNERRKAIELGLAGNADDTSNLIYYKSYNELKKHTNLKPENVDLDQLRKLSDDELESLYKEVFNNSGYFNNPNGVFANQIIHKVNQVKSERSKKAEEALKKIENDNRNKMIENYQKDEKLKLEALENTARSNSPAGRILDKKEITEINSLINLFRNNHYSKLTDDDVKLINKYSKELKDKREWSSKDKKFQGMKPDDDKLADNFAKALDNFVDNVQNGSSKSYQIAEGQQRKIKLPAKEINITDSISGQTRRVYATIASAESKATPDQEAVYKQLSSIHPGVNLNFEKSGFTFKPVIQFSKDFKTISNKIEKYGITSKELQSANISSTLDLLGFENNSLIQSDVLSLAKKIQGLRKTGDWIRIKGELNENENLDLDKLVEVIFDHSKSYRPVNIQRLKKFDAQSDR